MSLRLLVRHSDTGPPLGVVSRHVVRGPRLGEVAGIAEEERPGSPCTQCSVVSLPRALG